MKRINVAIDGSKRDRLLKEKLHVTVMRMTVRFLVHGKNEFVGTVETFLVENLQRIFSVFDIRWQLPHQIKYIDITKSTKLYNEFDRTSACKRSRSA